MEMNQLQKQTQRSITFKANGDDVTLSPSIVRDYLVGGWCEVYRKDRDIPVRVEISLSEFSKGQSTWKTMPATMIRKTAIVNALREAFPETLGALYTEDDDGQMQMQQTKKPVQATENSKAKNKADALIAQAMDPEHVQQQETEEFQREPRPVDLFNPAEEYSK